MKSLKFIFKSATLAALLIAVASSCSKDDQNPEYSYFVSKQFVVNYKMDYINNLIDLVSVAVPDVITLKPLVSDDVNIYKLVYNTTVNGSQIRASGLVCVPADKGDYPVLSFQNGTNPLNAYAPSESAIDFTYQMVEIIASMGYIVVIADYPGFGESSQITHPYLIAEPTVRSLVDMLYAVKELFISEIPGISLMNEFYLLGYSQGGWATLALHKAMELEYAGDFNLKGSTCGAGPYNISMLVQGMVNVTTYPMPVYLGYLINSYVSYDQFTNPVSDIINEPYASKIGSLYDGLHTAGDINSQLTSSITDLLTDDFLSGFPASPKYASVRAALSNNSVSAWHTLKPLLFIHGEIDEQVSPLTTEYMHADMLLAGTSSVTCKKVIVPGVDHSGGILPCMIQGILFLKNLSD